MFPHADTIYTTNALDHEQKVRLAARERLAASVQTGKHSPSIMSVSARRVRTTFFSGFMMRQCGAKWVRLSRQLTRGSAQPAHRVI
jgi:hypothetical protein